MCEPATGSDRRRRRMPTAIGLLVVLSAVALGLYRFGHLLLPPSRSLPGTPATSAGASGAVRTGDSPNRQEILDEITAAFAGVTREGGVSWSESVVLDDYGSAEECAAARARDKDQSWNELIQGSEWNPEPGVGGFSFLDAIGFRYYLAPAMILSVRDGYDRGIQFHLTMYPKGHRLRDHCLGQLSQLDDRQARAVAKFVLYMRDTARADNDAWDAARWDEAYRSYWREILEPKKKR